MANTEQDRETEIAAIKRLIEEYEQLANEYTRKEEEAQKRAREAKALFQSLEQERNSYRRTAFRQSRIVGSLKLALKEIHKLNGTAEAEEEDEDNEYE